MKQFMFLILMVSLISMLSYSFDDVDLDDIRTWGISSVTNLNIPTRDGNPLKTEIIELGKKLFFDPRLSKTNKTSCATCHDPKKGFSDGLAKFKGDNQNRGERRSPSIQNLAWSPLLFWDGRAKSLEEQALMPIAAEGEMNQDLASLVIELKKAGYLELFKNAFGKSAEINEKTIAKSIADFERSLISHNSAFDKYVSGELKAMSDSQIKGMRLFIGKANCSACHNGPNFTDNGFHDLGLSDDDLGRFKILELNAMNHAFKTPGLRDVSNRGPFMHNGSLATLADVIDYYDQGGEYPNRRRDPQMKKLNLTQQEKTELIEFLRALTGTGAIDIKSPMLPGIK